MEQVGRYELVRKLAKGGMGEVYLARAAGAKGFRKTVVLKRIHPHLAAIEEFVEMFLNEGRLAAQFDHANVVQIFDLGEDAGTYYIAMEYVDGPTLFTLVQTGLARGQLLPFEIVMKIVAYAMEGLHYAHTFKGDDGRPLNLIHRDISPDNILLARSGGVKVADFGVARATTLPRVTQTGAFKGKVSYLAPETLKIKTFDHRVDLFSTGVVLYEALTGMKPFKGKGPTETLEAIVKTEPRDLLELRPDAPPELRDLVLRCLSKDPAGRPATARALQLELEGLLVARGQVVSASDIATFIEELCPPKPEPAPSKEEKPTAGQGARQKLRPQADVSAGPTEAAGAKPSAPPARRRSSAFAKSSAVSAAEPTEQGAAEIAPEDQVLSEEEEQERAPRPQRGEKRVVPTSVLIGGFALSALVLIGYMQFAPHHRARVAGAHVEDIGEKKLLVDSDPPGAEVWVQGQRMGVTPYDADNDYPFGAKLDLKVRMLGMADVSTAVAGGRGQKVSAVLLPPPPPDE